MEGIQVFICIANLEIDFSSYIFLHDMKRQGHIFFLKKILCSKLVINTYHTSYKVILKSRNWRQTCRWGFWGRACQIPWPRRASRGGMGGGSEGPPRACWGTPFIAPITWGGQGFFSPRDRNRNSRASYI